MRVLHTLELLHYLRESSVRQRLGSQELHLVLEQPDHVTARLRVPVGATAKVQRQREHAFHEGVAQLSVVELRRIIAEAAEQLTRTIGFPEGLRLLPRPFTRRDAAHDPLDVYRARQRVARLDLARDPRVAIRPTGAGRRGCVKCIRQVARALLCLRDRSGHLGRDPRGLCSTRGRELPGHGARPGLRRLHTTLAPPRIMCGSVSPRRLISRLHTAPRFHRLSRLSPRILRLGPPLRPRNRVRPPLCRASGLFGLGCLPPQEGDLLLRGPHRVISSHACSGRCLACTTSLSLSLRLRLLCR